MTPWLIGQIGSLAVGNKRVEFDRVPASDSNIKTLGSLVFDMRDTLGSKAFVDLHAVAQHKLLARDLIAALYEYAAPSRIGSDYSIQNYGTVIRELLGYCSIVGVPDDFRAVNIGEEFLLDYRVYLRQSKVEFRSESRRVSYGNLVRLLQAGMEIGLVSTDLQPPRNFKYVGDSDATQPYSAGEALDFEEACRCHIRELLGRLEKGQELLKEGRNPKGRPKRYLKEGALVGTPLAGKAWNQLPNLLWYIVNCMDGKYLKRPELMAGGHSSFNSSMMGTWGGLYRKADVYSHLYPLTDDLIPFCILLAKKAGLNESSILDLNRDCLQERDGRYFLEFTKHRGEYRLLIKPISNDGPFSPVALIQTLQRITEPMVRHAASEDQGKLLLGLTVDGHGLAPIKPLDPTYILAQMNREGGWCDQRELVDEHGNPLKVSFKRWRVYYLGRRYQKHGQLSKVSRDAAHTLSKTSVGYVNNGSTRHIHDRALEDGIQAAKAVARPIVLSDDSVDVASQMLGGSFVAAERVLRGEQDVFFASCKDFYNRPGGPQNTPCDKPWICLVCSNAIITRHVLPRVLAFRNFMLEQKAELSSEDWSEKFATAWKVLIADILPKFSTEALAEAERHVADETLYIPLALKV